MDKLIGLFKGQERPTTMEQTLKLDEVIVDNDLNPRQGALDQDVVLDYSAHVDELPPMVAFDVQGFYFLVGGFHRYAAHRLAQRSEGRFVVHQGSREEAKEFADLDNLKHGLRLSRAEKRGIIERQLKRHPDWSDARLAVACCTTDKTVRVVREELEANLGIPRLDVLVGADGIERPRTVSRPAPQPIDTSPQTSLEGVAPLYGDSNDILRANRERAALESTAPIPPMILRPVGELEQAMADSGADEAEWQRLRGEIAPVVEDEDGESDWTKDDRIGEDPPPPPMTTAEAAEKMQALASDLAAYQPAGEPRPEPPATDPQPGEAEMMVSQAVEAAPPAPVPAPKPPLPPPMVGEAFWFINVTLRANGGPPIVTLKHGDEAKQHMPAHVAEKVIGAIQAKIEPAIVMNENVPVAAPEWLAPPPGVKTVNNGD